MSFFFFFALDGILNSKKIENKWEKITIGLQLIIFISSLHEHKSRFEYRHTLLHILHTLNWKVCFKSKN